MAIDVSNFIVQPDDSRGLYQLADTLEKKRYRDQQVANQKAQQKNASVTYLNNYLDKKDYLSGTVGDPVIVNGINDAMTQGMELINKGADPATIQMALSPLVGKISQYSTKAKVIKQQITDSASKLKQYKGYNLDALIDEATKGAFFDEKGGLRDINNVDPATDWIGEAIKRAPEKVTTAEGLNEFAKNTPMSKMFSDITTYDANGAMNKTKAHLTGQNFLQPDVDEKGVTIGMVPRHDIATENGSPIMHTFVGADGKEVKAAPRLLDEGTFNNMMGQRPDVADYINSLVRQHIKEYKDTDGNPIDINSPKAKLLARAIAYDELNRRKSSSIENVQVQDKPSNQELNIRMINDPRYIQGQGNLARVRAQARTTGKGLGKTNIAETITEIFNNNPDFLNVETVEKDGRNVLDVTGVFPKGGITHGKGDAFKYGSIYYDPEKRELLVDQVSGTPTDPTTKTETIKESDIPKFITQTGPANGLNVQQIRKLLSSMGYDYNAGAFTGAGDAPTIDQSGIEPKKDVFQQFKAAPKMNAVDILKEFVGKSVNGDKVLKMEGDYVPWSKSEFRMNLQRPDGSKYTMLFKNKDEMVDFLKGDSKAPAKAPVNTNADDLLKKYE